MIDKYVNPRVNECFERYNFLKRVQKEGETFEHFITECRHLIRTCNYGVTDPNESTEDKALRDKIVMGIRDATTREALLRMDQPTLEKAIHFCRASEQSKNQNIQIQQGAVGAEASRVRKDKAKVRRNQNVSKQDVKSKVRDECKNDSVNKFKCRRCHKMHGPQECPAFGKKCNRCGILNHFSVACRVKNVENTEQQKESESDDSDFFIGNVDMLGNVNKNIFRELIEIEGKKINVKLDTGAEISVLPKNIF